MFEGEPRRHPVREVSGSLAGVAQPRAAVARGAAHRVAKPRQAQAGLAGPASSLYGMMGIRLPDDADSRSPALPT